MSSKVVVVTGASSGIGFQTAKMAQENDYIVVWASRQIESNSDVIAIANSKSYLKNLDVSDENSVSSFFKEIGIKFGKIDFLINCAGFVQPESLLNTTLENWNKTVNINLTGLFLCTKEVVKYMKNLGGKIINIASTAGLTPRPGWSAYAAAKSGVINFSGAISEELAIYNIKVYVICPGRTATPLRKILAPHEDPQSIMQPESVSKLIIYLLTDEADPLEGQPILVRERF